MWLPWIYPQVITPDVLELLYLPSSLKITPLNVAASLFCIFLEALCEVAKAIVSETQKFNQRILSP